MREWFKALMDTVRLALLPAGHDDQQRQRAELRKARAEHERRLSDDFQPGIVMYDTTVAEKMNFCAGAIVHARVYRDLDEQAMCEVEGRPYEGHVRFLDHAANRRIERPAPCFRIGKDPIGLG